MTDLPTQIRAILRRYKVLSHWRSARDAGKPSYGLWADGKQIGEPMKHREAQDLRETMIANDIEALIESFGTIVVGPQHRSRPSYLLHLLPHETAPSSIEEGVAQPNWDRLGFAGIEGAEGRN